MVIDIEMVRDTGERKRGRERDVRSGEREVSYGRNERGEEWEIKFS